VLARNLRGGTGLQVSGSSVFSRSGTATITAGQTKVTVTPPGGLTSASLALVLMQNVAGAVAVKAAVPNTGAGTFDIRVNQAVGPARRRPWPGSS